MTPGEDRINIAFGIDQAYIPYFIATLHSILRSNAGCNEFNCWIVATDDIRNPVTEAIGRARAEFPHFGRVTLQFLDDTYRGEYKPRDPRLVRASLNRLRLFSLPREHRRVIYCDSDLIFDTDISALWRIPFDGRDLIAAPDGGIPRMKNGIAAEVLSSLHLSPEAPYFNAGVMVINLDNPDSASNYDRLLGIDRDYGGMLAIPDQDILNLAFCGRCKLASLQWNYQTGFSLMTFPGMFHPVLNRADVRRYDRGGAVYHYTGEWKPWIRSYFPLSSRFWDSLGPLASKLGLKRKPRTPGDFVHFWITKLQFFLRRELLRIPISRSVEFARRRIAEKQARAGSPESVAK
jgi:lipopolysaccharide biosynthesis glycosyltransferase